MLFNSYIFLLFLLIVLPVFYQLPSKKSKNIFILISSYLFYSYWDWRFSLLLVFSTLIDFSIGKRLNIEQNINKRKVLLICSLFTNLGILGYFKYFNFFADSFQELINSFGGNLDYLHFNIILPVGVSFYTFQTLSYTIDVYRKKLEPTQNLIDFGVFVSFFPQLVAGPIERAKNLLPQISKKLSPSPLQIKQGIVLIITGLFRKVIIGDTAGLYVDHIFNDIGSYKSIELISALILFSVQIYADFSGYSKIARGTSKLLGVELMINFEQPYLSQNITDFWRRWHISLSTWLRDYVYFSLGGNKKGILNTYRNLMLTMLIGGLWHGASWNFVIWGSLHGIYLIVHKYSSNFTKTKKTKQKLFSFTSIFNIITTYFLVLITWLFFRSTNWEMTVLFIEKIIHWEKSEFTIEFISISASFLLITVIFDIIEFQSGSHTFFLKLKYTEIQIGILLAMLFTTLIYMFQANALPFIYFQF